MSDLRQQQLAIVDATLGVCAETGYLDATVDDIARQAGVRIENFHRLFSGKEDAFLELLSIEERRLFSRIESRSVKTADTARRIEIAIRAALGWVDENPRDARVCIVESTRATTRIFQRREQTLDRLAASLRSCRPGPGLGSPPELLEELLVGGVCEVLGDRLSKGDAAPVSDLAPELIELFLRSCLSTADA
jgi:AcrR family transcriptional regulator